MPTLWNGQINYTFSFFVFIFSILSVAAGYIINDWYDWEIDRINHPQKKTLSKNQLLQHYIIFIFLHLLWVIIGIYYFQFPQVWLLFFLVSNVLQWWYSFRLKCTPLWGNLLVAFFGSYYIYLVLVGQSMKWENILFSVSMTYLLVFSFLSTLWREVVKDMEDWEGDAQFSCKTFPVRYGWQKSRNLVIIVATIFLVSLIYFGVLFWSNGFVTQTYYLMSILLIASVFLFYKSCKLTDRTDAKNLSKWLKIYMLLGLLLVALN